MQTELWGGVTIPVTIDDINGRWLVDTGNVTSMISTSIVSELKLKRFEAPGGVMMGGVSIHQTVHPHQIVLAGMRDSSATLDVAPTNVLDDDTIGMLAPDIMQQFDIDFDFAAGKLNIFSHDHCPDRVVYWTQSNYARVPMKLDAYGHITIPVSLDGRQIIAIVDTGAETSFMTLEDVRSVFGLHNSNSELIATGTTRINGMPATETYGFDFGTLTLEGVQITKPNIVVVKSSGIAEDKTQITLGIETLRQLHMYIAYDEQALYFTAAEAR